MLSGLIGLEPGDCGDSGDWEDDDSLPFGNSSGFRAGLSLGQAIVITWFSGSGDQQLSDNQQPITTVARPINRASIMYTSALPAK